MVHSIAAQADLAGFPQSAKATCTILIVFPPYRHKAVGRNGAGLNVFCALVSPYSISNYKNILIVATAGNSEGGIMIRV